MGGWQLEVFRMGVYMAFPVGLFYWFNQPEYFEKWVVEKKRQMYPPESKNNHDQIQNLIKDMKDKDKEVYLRQLQQMDSRN
ncbi:protein PET100 homolog, mitochondrial [Culicoides brevitarsis]|uniref:protein PET100 homolog, mitochondrial n=1 Tax=Culicoides brevitarsis TaxID=469753 RepID=UPI00307C99F5